MAYAKKKYNSDLDSKSANTLSSAFNDKIFRMIKGELTLDEVKSRFRADIEAVKTADKSITSAAIKSFIDKVSPIFEADENSIYGVGNQLIDSYRKQGDIAFSKAKNDIMFFWLNSSYKSTKKWDVTWLRRITESEKFAPFVKSGQRYLFKGYYNQFVLNFAIEDYKKTTGRNQAENIVLFFGEMQDILAADVVKQKDVPIEESRKKHCMEIMRGKKSLTSVFVKTSLTSYKYADGLKWYPKEGEKQPSKEDIDSGKIIKYTVPNFISHPVWLVDMVLDDLPPSMKEKYEQLVEARVRNKDNVAVYEIPEEEKDLDRIVDESIQAFISQQAINVVEGGNAACFYTMRDDISVPQKKDFANPVTRFAVTMHELAHSTMHMAGRDYKGAFGSVLYAQEEIVAETTATLLTLDLEEKLTALYPSGLPENWVKFFDDHYTNSESYNKHWGGKFDFKTILDKVFDANIKLKGKKNDLFSKIMENCLDAYCILKTGVFNDAAITSEVREEAKLKNTLTKDSEITM